MMLIIAIFFTVSIVLAAVFAIRYFGPSGALQANRQMRDRIGQGQNPYVSTKGLRLESNISSIEMFQKFLRQHAFFNNISFLLKSARAPISVTVFLLVSVLLAFSAYALFNQAKGPFLGNVLAAVAIGSMPFLVLRTLRKRYLSQFEKYLPETLGIISSSIKVGHGLETALTMVAKRAPYPVNHEFRIVQNEMKLGLTMRAALDNLEKRIGSPELKIFVTGIAVQQELGGNLSELLDNLQKTIRERFALMREIKTLSAQGVMSAIVLFCLPVFFVIIWAKGNPVMFFEFINSPGGRKGMYICAGLQLIAGLWMRQIVKIKD